MKYPHQPSDGRAVLAFGAQVRALPPAAEVWIAWSADGTATGPHPALFIAFILPSYRATSDGVEHADKVTVSGRSYIERRVHFPSWADPALVEDIAEAFEYQRCLVFVREDWEIAWYELGHSAFWTAAAAREAAERMQQRAAVPRPPESTA